MGAIQNKNTNLPTTVGCGALIVWSLYALLISELLAHLPVFQTLFMMFTISFVAMSIRLTIKKQWNLLGRQPIWLWIVGVFGVCGSDVAYVAAASYAPPAHVDFIDFLWPFLVIFFTGFLPSEHFTLKHLIGGLLGLLGVFLLLTGGKGLVGFQSDYFGGYFFALCSALIWSAYTISMRWFNDMPMEMVGIFCGIGALFSLGLHLNTEVWITPSLHDLSLVLFLGLSSGLAYLLWSYGTQKGNIKLLGVLAYCTPIFSMTFLVLTGKEPLSVPLILACILVVSGVIVGSIDWNKLKQFLFNQTNESTPPIVDQN